MSLLSVTAARHPPLSTVQSALAAFAAATTTLLSAERAPHRCQLYAVLPLDLLSCSQPLCNGAARKTKY
ncbi:hypothetical protein OUZ56_027726 [Daphnia magna]|uniref:Secreted protein n=1 Tax=Daphnia magna TaxID=35525 RepID=A0ABR0B1Z4_9CRUS|nr:hypothetical protein OUZ56_027726 [Daphnia magna]